ncbi:hypothetical protein CEXT_428671, partial [Caerostris extrusa]
THDLVRLLSLCFCNLGNQEGKNVQEKLVREESRKSRRKEIQSREGKIAKVQQKETIRKPLEGRKMGLPEGKESREIKYTFLKNFRDFILIIITIILPLYRVT